MQRENDGCQSLKSVPHRILPISLCNEKRFETCLGANGQNVRIQVGIMTIQSEGGVGLFPEPSRYNRGFMASRVILTGQHKWQGPQRNALTQEF